MKQEEGGEAINSVNAAAVKQKQMDSRFVRFQDRNWAEAFAIPNMKFAKTDGANFSI